MIRRVLKHASWAVAMGLAGSGMAEEQINAADSSATVKTETQKETTDGLSDQQKTEKAQVAVQKMQDVLNKVLKYVQDARDERDVVKLNCINEKLSSIKGLLKISEQSNVVLRESLARRDAESAEHEFEKISIAQRKCEQLLTESEACVGDLTAYAGATELEVIVEGIKADDPTKAPDVPVVVERPPAASPYQ